MVEKAARAGRRDVRAEVLTKVLGRATDWRIEALEMRATARGADRAKLRRESIVIERLVVMRRDNEKGMEEVGVNGLVV